MFVVTSALVSYLSVYNVCSYVCLCVFSICLSCFVVTSVFVSCLSVDHGRVAKRVCGGGSSVVIVYQSINWRRRRRGCYYIIYISVYHCVGRELYLSVYQTRRRVFGGGGGGRIYPSIKEVGGGGLRRDGRVLLLSIYQCVMYIRSVNAFSSIYLSVIYLWHVLCVYLYSLFICLSLL